MSAMILPFPVATTATTPPIACYLRIGSAHQKLAELLAASRLPATRIVVDASRVGRHPELTSAFRETGAEIMLDAEVAELAAPAKFAGHARGAPWALPSTEGPLRADHFRRNSPKDVVGQIARFAVQSNFNAVLSPTHFVGDPTFRDWLAIDRESCVLLREALDGEGGSNIAIDYPVPISHTELNDQNRRGALTAALADLPVSNVWIRASGLDSTSGPLTVKRYLSALSNLHNLGKPIVAGHLGGLVGNAALAFGAISGVAHGIGERERFDASSWHKPPLPRSEDSRFGRATRIGVPGLNRSVTVDEIELLAAAKGGRRLVACSDRNRCPNGHLDMIADPRRHMSRQTFQAIAELQAIPDVKREHYFLNGPMDAADRLARQIKSLKPPASEAAKHKIDIDKLMARLNDHSRKIYQLKTALEQLHDTRSADSPRAKPVQSRQTKSREIKADRP